MRNLEDTEHDRACKRELRTLSPSVDLRATSVNRCLSRSSSRRFVRVPLSDSGSSSGRSFFDGVCSTSSGALEAERLGHVLDLGQIVDLVQAESNQEFLGGRVEERPADDLLAADDLDQMPLEQRVQHAGGSRRREFR